MEKEANNQQKKETSCPHCQVSGQTIQNLKEAGASKKEEYLSRKQQKEKERLGHARQRNIKRFIIWGAPVILLVGLMGFFLFGSGKNNNQSSTGEKTKITVFLSPTCSCCHNYVSYLKREGFEVEEKQVRDMLSIKEQYKISSEMESCHTSVAGNYFIEGHIPVEAIKKLLQEKPKIDGIALPGMPGGSPGMGGLKTGPFKIYQISNGSASEFLSI